MPMQRAAKMTALPLTFCKQAVF